MIVMPQLKSNDVSDSQLIPEIKRMQAKLKKIPRSILIRNSGVKDENGRLFITVFFQQYEIDPGNFDIIDATGERLYVMLKSIVLTYLTMSDGTLPSGNFISFRELPDGNNYCHAFQGYAPDRLSNYFKEDNHRLQQACLKIGGRPINLADLSFEFDVFPKIKIIISYFMGEDAFPSRASMLFDSNVNHYMVTAGMASIGYHLVDTIVNNSSL
jgi:hypothetical protein